MSNLQKFQNESFQDRVEWLRRNIAGVAFFLVAFSYTGAAVAIGIFVSKLLSPEFGVFAGQVMGYGLAFAAQLGRGTILFFGQGNPIRVHVHRYNWIIAVAMGLFSIWEVYHLIDAAHINIAVFWTFASAMTIGVIIEIFLAAEVDRFTKLELYENKAAWKELKDYHEGEKRFTAFLRDLKKNKLPVEKSIQDYGESEVSKASFESLNELVDKLVLQNRSLLLQLKSNNEPLDLVKGEPDLEKAALILEEQNYHGAAEVLNKVNGTTPGNGQTGNGKIG